MYDQFYGLQGRPFQLTPDPQFYFESATHRKALSYLGYGLAQGEGFIVITGDIGAGKTTLVGHLMNTIDPVRLTAIKIVSTQVEGDDMLRLAAQGFGIAADGVAKAQLLQRIEQYLHQQARAGRRTLLIVDEAQNLPVSALEELRMLSNFQLGGQSLLQIFLLGQPEFRDLLKSPELEQLRQRVIATHHLEPMMEVEVEPYIVHRLSVVGWSGNPRFTPDAFARFYAATDGVPRRVNALASRVLLMGAIDQLRRIDGAAVDTVAADMGLDVDQRPAAVASSILDHVEEAEPPVDMQGAGPMSELPSSDEANDLPDSQIAAESSGDGEPPLWPDAAEDTRIEAAFWQDAVESEISEQPQPIDVEAPSAVDGQHIVDEAETGLAEHEPTFQVSSWLDDESEVAPGSLDEQGPALEPLDREQHLSTAEAEAPMPVAGLDMETDVHAEAEDEFLLVEEDLSTEAEDTSEQASIEKEAFEHPSAAPTTTPVLQPDDQHLLAAMVDEIVRLRGDINGLHRTQDGQPMAEIAALDSRLVQIEQRLASLEAGTREQDAALRRVLALLVDWVEREERMANAA